MLELFCSELFAQYVDVSLNASSLSLISLLYLVKICNNVNCNLYMKHVPTNTAPTFVYSTGFHHYPS